MKYANRVMKGVYEQMNRIKRKGLALSITATLLVCALGTSAIASGTSASAAPPSGTINSTTLTFAENGLEYLASVAVSSQFSYAVGPVFSLVFPSKTGSELTQIQNSLNTIDTQLTKIQNSVFQLHNEINALSQSATLENQINDFYGDGNHFCQYESTAYACITEMNYIETLSGQAKMDEEKQFLLALYSKKELNGKDFCTAVCNLGGELTLQNPTTNDNFLQAVHQYVNLYNSGNKGKAVYQDFTASVIGVYTILGVFSEMSLLAAEQEPGIFNSSGEPISVQLSSLHKMNSKVNNLFQ